MDRLLAAAHAGSSVSSSHSHSARATGTLEVQDLNGGLCSADGASTRWWHQELLLKGYRRLQIYIQVNTFVVLLGFQQLWLADFAGAEGTSSRWMGIYVGGCIRISLSLLWFTYLGSFKTRINDRDSTKEHSRWSPICKMLFMAGTMEALMLLFLEEWQWLELGRSSSNTSAFAGGGGGGVLREFLWFIPKSFVIEIVFDFGHYWVHRLCHWSAWLYANVHGDHHQHHYPGPLSTYEQSALDIVLSNIVPIVSSLALGPQLTFRQFYWLFAYKTYIEVAGHCGLDVKGPTFSQMPLVGYLTDICMVVADHDRHHTKRRVNFSKRFKLWDLVFATYSPN